MFISNTDKTLITSKIKLLQLYCLLQSFLIKTLSFAVQSFKGVISQGYLTCSLANPRGLIQTPPFIGGACPHALAVNYGFFLSHIHCF